MSMISDEQWQLQQTLKDDRQSRICCMPCYALYVLLNIVAFVVIHVVDLEPARKQLNIKTLFGVKMVLCFFSVIVIYSVLFFGTFVYMHCYSDPRRIRGDRERRQNNRRLQMIGGEQYVMMMHIAA